jgi:hypothetical protein
LQEECAPRHEGPGQTPSSVARRRAPPPGAGSAGAARASARRRATAAASSRRWARAAARIRPPSAPDQPPILGQIAHPRRARCGGTRGGWPSADSPPATRTGRPPSASWSSAPFRPTACDPSGAPRG